MNRSRTILGFAAGLLVGLALAVAWPGDLTARRAAARENDSPPPYQISSWAHPAASNNVGVVDRGRYGAYVIDTRSGKVWLIEEKGEPKSIGRVR